MSLTRTAVSVIVGLLFVVVLVNSATNCGVGSADCNKCGSNITWLVVQTSTGYGFVKVCCKQTCSRYYRTSNFISGGKLYATCTCVEEQITGNCWKGSQCTACSSVGSINGLPICCPNCAASGMSISSTSCNCPSAGK